MNDLVLPLSLRWARSRVNYIDATGVTRGWGSGGTAETTDFGGSRVGATIDFTPHGGRTSEDQRERAKLQSSLMALRGKSGRIWLGDDSYLQEGNFPAPEIFSNSDFSLGTNGWTAGGTGAISVDDAVLRLAATASGGTPSLVQSVSLVQNAPYALRSFIMDGLNSSGLSVGVQLALSGSVSVTTYSTSRGYHLASGVVLDPGSISRAAAVIASTTGYTSDVHIEVPFTSLARCMLVDGGGNRLQYSDQQDNAAWTKTELTATANAATAPDGTSTAEKLTESTNLADHFILQAQPRTSQAEDLCAYGYFKQNTLDRDVRLQIDDGAGNGGFAIFDLSAGTVGSVTGLSAGSHARAFISSAGGDWYLCQVIARCPATTSIRAVAYMVSAGAINYTGTTGAISSWRMGAYQSSVPTRGTQTTNAAVAAETRAGVALYVKGLPASTTNLLRRGAWIEIDGQLRMVTTRLDSNAAGLGYLQFSPPLRRAVSDNTPIIVHRPMGRFMLAGDAGFNNVPGRWTSASIDLEEANAA